MRRPGVRGSTGAPKTSKGYRDSSVTLSSSVSISPLNEARARRIQDFRMNGLRCRTYPVPGTPNGTAMA